MGITSLFVKRAVDLPRVQYCTLDDWKHELCGSDAPQSAVVALGKFDAMHKGHR